MYLSQDKAWQQSTFDQDPKDPTGTAFEHAYQNSWGLTQRTIGVMARCLLLLVSTVPTY